MMQFQDCTAQLRSKGITWWAVTSPLHVPRRSKSRD